MLALTMRGPAGADGAVGPQGPAGADGADGAVGPQGPAGPAPDLTVVSPCMMLGYNTNATVVLANRIHVRPFTLSGKITPGIVRFINTWGGHAGSVLVGIYKLSTGALIAETAELVYLGGNPAQQDVAFIAGGAVLQPGEYLFAWSATSVDMSMASAYYEYPYNACNKYWGYLPNVIAGAFELPANINISTIIPDSSRKPWFELYG